MEGTPNATLLPLPERQIRLPLRHFIDLGRKTHNIGQVGQFIGSAGVVAGLGAAAIGGIATAPAGGAGAAPGLSFAGGSAKVYGVASLATTGGNIMMGLAGDDRAMGSAIADLITMPLKIMGGIGPIGETITGNGVDVSMEVLAGGADQC